jgi:RNA polymerase sigma factor (sigma-70 family)
MNLFAALGINLAGKMHMLRDPSNVPRPSPGAERSSDASDVVLISRVCAGDLRAFESLYRLYHPRLTRFLGLMTSRRPVVEEVLNDTMLVVWRRCGSFNGQCKLSTWIFAIAYRTAMKALRGRDDPVDDSLFDDTPSDEPNPEQRRSQRETVAAIAQALEGLSTEQRSVLVLTYFHDLPYAEIAQIIDCPVDTVKTRMFHGRRRLRALLSGTLGDWL